MSDLRNIADRVEIEALRGEFTDAALAGDHDGVAELFTEDGVWRIPDAGVHYTGRQAIRDGIARLQGFWDFFLQNTHPGVIRVDGDTATGRAHIVELGRFRDGRSHQNYAIYHDTYLRTPDGWRFTERVYEIKYMDTSPLAGTVPTPGSVAVDVEAPVDR